MNCWAIIKQPLIIVILFFVFLIIIFPRSVFACELICRFRHPDNPYEGCWYEWFGADCAQQGAPTEGIACGPGCGTGPTGCYCCSDWEILYACGAGPAPTPAPGDAGYGGPPPPPPILDPPTVAPTPTPTPTPYPTIEVLGNLKEYLDTTGGGSACYSNISTDNISVGISPDVATGITTDCGITPGAGNPRSSYRCTVVFDNQHGLNPTPAQNFLLSASANGYISAYWTADNSCTATANNSISTTA